MVQEAQDRGATFSRDGVVRGMRAAVPIGIGVTVYGVVFGILARQVGLSPLENLAMNVFVLAGAAQTASLDSWAYPLPILAIVTTTLLINLRLILLGAAVRPWLHHLPGRKVYPMLHIMTDEGWSVAMAAHRNGEQDIGFFFGSSIVVVASWFPGIIGGYLLGGGIGDPGAIGLDFAFTAIFTAMLFGSFRRRFDLLPWGVAGLAALTTSKILPGTWYVLAGGIAGFATGLLFGSAEALPDSSRDGAP